MKKRLFVPPEPFQVDRWLRLTEPSVTIARFLPTVIVALFEFE